MDCFARERKLVICMSAVCTHDVGIPWLRGMLVTRICMCLFQKTIYFPAH